MNLEKLLSEVPLTLNDKERDAIVGFAHGLQVAGHNGSKGLMVGVNAACAPALHLVIMAGLRAIDEGLITFTDPPQSRRNPGQQGSP